MIKSKKNSKNNKKAKKANNNDIITAAAVATEQVEQVEQIPEPVEETPPAASAETVVETEAEAEAVLTEQPVQVSEVSEVPVPTPKSQKVTSGKRGRPAIDRELIKETLINTLRDLFPDEVFFSRKQVANLGLPPSYIIYFTKVAKTPVRGLYVLPPSWRKEWAGYSEALKSALKAILTGSN